MIQTDPDFEVSHLIILEDSYTKRTIYLTRNSYSLGRNANNNIVIYSELVSRYHARLIKQNSNREERYQILDGDDQGHRSSNGIFINGKRCQSHQLKYGDVVVLGGNVKLTYYNFKYFNQNKVQANNCSWNKFPQQMFDKTTINLSENIINSTLIEASVEKQNSLEFDGENYYTVIQQISEGIILLDSNLKQIIKANNAYCQLLDYSESEILNLTIYDLIALSEAEIDHHLQSVVEHQKNLIVESQHRHRQGQLISVEENISLVDFGDRQVLCLAIRDITGRKLTEATLQHQAFHDQLTGLPNRTLFNQHLHKIATSRHNQQLFAVFFLDLDHFKQINDTYGHAIGDQLLQSFASRVQGCLRSSDILARWGGDEFTILLDQITSAEDAVKIGQRIINSLSTPFELSQHQIDAKASIGIALYPQDSVDGSNLIKQADIALYRAKSQGKNKYQFYNAQNHLFASTSLKLENQLYDAFKGQQLALQYQPRMALHTGKITAVEASLQWHHPQLGRIAPAQIQSIAEQSGLIVELSQWMWQTACTQLRAWQKESSSITMAVNLATGQLKIGENYIPNLIQHTLAQNHIAAEFLELQINETILQNNSDRLSKILPQLVDQGVHLCLNDFGAGYSSLNYLNQFPFRSLKLEPSLIQNSNSGQNTTMIQAIIAAAKCFNVEVVAQAVQNQQQQFGLRSLGCSQIQGDWPSPPLTAELATSWLKERLIN